MPENNGVYFLELPGMPVQGTLSEENLIVLHEHRDVHISLSSPENAQYRISSTQTPFYIPEKKKLFTEYTFSSQDNIHAWFSKFDQWTLQIDKQTDQGWKPLSLIDPKEVDGNDYSHLLARPAPIVLDTRPCHTNSQGNADERLPLIQPPQDSTQEQPSSETTLHGQISAANHERLREVRRRALEQSHETFSSLSAKWKQTQWMTREEGMRLCHASPPEPERIYLIELLQGTPAYEYFGRVTSGGWHVIKSLYEESMLKDAFFAMGVEVIDKGKVIFDTRGIEYSFRESRLKDGTIKRFIIFKGNPQKRIALTGTRYGITNKKVFALAAQKASLAEIKNVSLHEARSILLPKEWAGKFFYGAIVLDTFYWWQEGNNDIAKLFSTLISTILAFEITSLIMPSVTYILGSALAAAGVGAATLTITVGGCAIVVAVSIGFLISTIGVDKLFYNLFKKASEEYKALFD